MKTTVSKNWMQTIKWDIRKDRDVDLNILRVMLFRVRFDLLKNRELDWTTFVVSCLIPKLVMGLDK
jgi:hypothetical protein